MPRTVLSALIIAFGLLAGSAQAQRLGGHGGAAPMRGGTHHPNPRNSVLVGRPHFRHSHNFGSVFLPYGYGEYGYGEPFGYDQQQLEVVTKTPTPPPAVVLQTDKQQASQEARAITPKLIEIPSAADSRAPKTRPPAIFFLVDGQRLETSRYMLTCENLSVSIGRQQRIIPISMLDLDATVEANRKRGIELRIPSDRNEISLSF